MTRDFEILGYLELDLGDSEVALVVGDSNESFGCLIAEKDVFVELDLQVGSALIHAAADRDSNVLFVNLAFNESYWRLVNDQHLGVSQLSSIHVLENGRDVILDVGLRMIPIMRSVKHNR